MRQDSDVRDSAAPDAAQQTDPDPDAPYRQDEQPTPVDQPVNDTLIDHESSTRLETADRSIDPVDDTGTEKETLKGDRPADPELVDDADQGDQPADPERVDDAVRADSLADAAEVDETLEGSIDPAVEPVAERTPDSIDGTFDGTVADAETPVPLDDFADDANADANTGPATPLWDNEAADDLRQRWQSLQLRFVDDPRAVATEAQTLVGEAVNTLTNSLAERQRLLDGWDTATDDTEQLRVTVQRYRDLFELVLGR
jgi:hypothetical protein